MALTENGLEIPRLQELKQQLADDLQQNLGVPVDTSSNAVAGIINAVYAAGLSNGYELLQVIYDQRKLDSADGVNLDDLVAYTGIVRLSAGPTRVETTLFTGNNGVTIPQGAVVNNPDTSDRFLVELPTRISTLNAYEVTLSVNQVLNSTDYEITVNNSLFSYTSDSTATESEILDGIVSAFSGVVGYTVTRDGDTLVFQSASFDTQIEVVQSTFFSIEEVSVVGSLVSEENGPISAPENSITQIFTPVAGWTAVNNPVSGILGRNRESDEELLARQQQSVSISGSGTSDAIVAAIRALEGVTTAFIVENDSAFIDSEFRPPKSYELVIVGGLDQTIAQEIWDTKPVGIETFGTELGIATDIDGQQRNVRFSRPSQVFVHVRVTYTLYDEEQFPSAGEDAIRESILSTGEALNIDQDVIPKRFYGPVYSSVDGIQDLVVEMTTTAQPGDTPASWSENPIEIGFRQISDFSADRITIVSP